MSKDLTLYGITEEFEKLTELLEDGEITENYEAVESHLVQLLSNKVDGCVMYTESIDDTIKLAKEKISKLRDYIKVLENRKERFTDYTLTCMDKLKTDCFKGDLYEIKKRKPSKRLEIKDKENIPLEFIEVVQEYKVDKRGLTNAIKEGLKVDGVELVDGKQSLNFKMKSQTRSKNNE